MNINELTDALTGPALDWAVNQIEECCDDPCAPLFSTDWAQGGPIIEREGIAIGCVRKGGAVVSWIAVLIHEDKYFGGVARAQEFGPTPLIAAMRCYVASKLGDYVDIPEELVRDNLKETSK